MHIFHKWTKWGKQEQYTIYDMSRPQRLAVGFAVRQERTCTICNKLQVDLKQEMI